MINRLAVLLILLCGCSLFEPKTTQDDIPLTNTHWVLYTLNGNAVPNLPSSIFLEFKEEKRKKFTGYAGCNPIFGEFTLNPNTINFEDISSTRKTCHYQNLENEFIEMLKTGTHFKIRGHQLSIYQSNTIIATFKAI